MRRSDQNSSVVSILIGYSQLHIIAARVPARYNDISLTKHTWQ
jgi:hypothetical protein